MSNDWAPYDPNNPARPRTTDPSVNVWRDGGFEAPWFMAYEDGHLMRAPDGRPLYASEVPGIYTAGNRIR